MASPVHADPFARWKPYIAEASQRFAIPELWIRKVIYAESRGQTMRGRKPIRSRVGAMGLMQIMPGTWQDLRVSYGLGHDPDDPRDNILGGTAYLREMYELFGYPGLFAAYNAGPARYAAFRAGRAALPAETRAYIASISGNRILSPVKAPLTAPDVRATASTKLPPTLFVGLFVGLQNQPQRPSKGLDPLITSPLFVTLRTARE